MTDTKWYPAIDPMSGMQEQGVVGRFENLDVLDIAASKAADKKVYRKIIILRTKATSSSDDCVQPVKPHNQESFARRFPQAWAAFQGEDVQVPGIPLAELGDAISEQQILTCRMFGVMTVEQMAAATDGGCEAMGFGFRTLRQAAKAHLAAIEAETQAKMRALVNQPVQATTEAATAVPAPKRRGRPAKSANELHPQA